MRIYVGAVPLVEHSGRVDFYIECPGCRVRKRLVDFYSEGVRPMSCGSINALRLMEFVGSFGMEHSGCPNE